MSKQIAEEGMSQSTKQEAIQDIPMEAIQQKLASVQSEKEKLDYIFHGIADHIGIEFHSRIKAPDTIASKIAQKRLQGRNYSLDDINDAYGGRFIVKQASQKEKIINIFKKADSIGLFTINKAEPVKTGTYSAYHIDFQTPNGVKGEAQIMNPSEQLESVANHSLRALHGENPDPAIIALRDRQAKISSTMPYDKALQKASQIQAVSKQINGKPLDPRIIASILKQ